MINSQNGCGDQTKIKINPWKVLTLVLTIVLIVTFVSLGLMIRSVSNMRAFDLILSIDIDDETYYNNDSLVLSVVLYNNGSLPLNINTISFPETLRIEISNSTNVYRVRYSTSYQMPVEEREPLQPRTKYNVTIDLSSNRDWWFTYYGTPRTDFNFSAEIHNPPIDYQPIESGNYRIQAFYTNYYISGNYSEDAIVSLKSSYIYLTFL